MRSFEGYVTGIGVGLSLAAGSAVVLTVLSTMLAVTDWSGLAATGLGRDVVLADSVRPERSASRHHRAERSPRDVTSSDAGTAIVLSTGTDRRDARAAAVPSRARNAAPARRGERARRTGIAHRPTRATRARLLPDPAPATEAAAAPVPAASPAAPSDAPAPHVTPEPAERPRARSTLRGTGGRRRLVRDDKAKDTATPQPPATRAIETADPGGRGKRKKHEQHGGDVVAGPREQTPAPVPAPPAEAPPVATKPGKGHGHGHGNGNGRGKHRG